MNTPRVDELDPKEQERIRRGPHAYVAGEGVHGRYVALPPYVYQPYPKRVGDVIVNSAEEHEALLKEQSEAKPEHKVKK